MAQKRERGVNFTREETNILFKLVKANKHIIENKKSDAVTWGEKECCWKSIEAAFNSMSGETFRGAKTLKIKYEGMKRYTKRKIAPNCASLRTGGGSKPAPQLTPVEKKVRNMLLSVDGLESTDEDSDHVEETAATPKRGSSFNKLTEAKLEIVALQKQILKEELENKRKQWIFEEEERQHKRLMWDLEKSKYK